MFDRDVELLQFCAANLDPKQFLVHLLHKFGLVTWAAQVRHFYRFIIWVLNSLSFCQTIFEYRKDIKLSTNKYKKSINNFNNIRALYFVYTQ